MKTAMLGASTSLPPLLDRGGKLVWSAEEKVSLFSADVNAKQCRGSFQKPQACEPSPVLYSVVFWSRFICSLLLDLDRVKMIPMVCFHFI